MLQIFFSSGMIPHEKRNNIIRQSLAPKCTPALALELSHAGTLMGMLVHEDS